MKKTLPTLILLALFVLVACQERAPNTADTEAATEEAVAPAATDGEGGREGDAETEQREMLAFYLAKFRSYRQLQGSRLHETTDQIDKHYFEHLENWFSIDVNDDGVTYTGVFELTQDDTLTHYISIQPEIYMEGGYVNYYDEPGFEYHFQNNRLTQTMYHDPQNEAAENPLANLSAGELVSLGDSITQRVKTYFYLDTSQTNFNGVWDYPLNSLAFSFDIKLKQIGSFVYGSYCVETPEKYDCGSVEQQGEPCHLNGYRLADTLHLTFTSCLAQRDGHAKLYVENDTLHWNTVYQVEASMVPDQISLVRFR